MRYIGLLCLLTINSVRAQEFVPDPQFGEQGISIHQGPSDVTNATPVAMLHLPDGRFLMGSMIGYNGGFISRHLTNGDRDSSFANNGVLHLSTPPDELLQMRALAVSEDGLITVFSMRQPAVGYGKTLQFDRYMPDGAPDGMFGSNGRVSMPVSDNTSIRSLAIQADGKVLFAGNMDGAFMLGRLEPDGEPDAGFGNDGVILYPAVDLELSLSRMRLAPNGDIFLVGSLAIGFDAIGLAVCKVQPDGALDTTFGNGGFFLHDHSENIFLYEALNDLHIRADGSLVVAGSIALDGVKERFCVLKLRPDGTLDTAFGDGGMVLHGTLSTDRNILMDMVYDPRGFYVLFGSLLRNGEVTRSMYTFMDGSGTILADANGETDHLITGPDLPGFTRRLVVDGTGGFVEGLGFSFRPIGISALRRFVFSSPTALSTAPAAYAALRAWPNPTSGTLQVGFARPADQGTTITVMDPLGRVVADERSIRWSFSGGRSITVDLPNTIAEGRYSLVLATDTERNLAHIVVQR